MSEVKIVLKRSPLSAENGVWIDGKKLQGVKEVTVFGAAGQIPQVVLTLLPEILTIGVDDPDIEKIADKMEDSDE